LAVDCNESNTAIIAKLLRVEPAGYRDEVNLSLLHLVQWLDNTPLSLAMRSNDYFFAIDETLHVLGVSMSVGLIMWVDLRLLGWLMPDKPVSAILEMLEPWAIVGFGLMFVSGVLLLLSEPMKCYTTIAFRIKVVMLILAGLNVWYFHSRVYRHVAEWDDARVPPWTAKFVGLASLSLWFGIIIAGRWTAYF
jgi:hypothetical protein